jgi:NADPH:quinone reductase-like Zn-dependent oxidoreductase
MIKLTDILSEILNTYEIDMVIQSNTDENISDILDQIRALRKITTVKNITPPEYPQKQNVEFTKVNIKFLSRTGKPEEDLEEFRQEILKSGEDDQRRIPGVTSVKFDTDTLRRI